MRQEQIYLVGGAVRDKLLGLTITERDWVIVGGSTEDLISRGFRQIGKDFPVFLHPETNEEYALARTEKKSGLGHKGFELNFPIIHRPLTSSLACFFCLLAVLRLSV